MAKKWTCCLVVWLSLTSTYSIAVEMMTTARAQPEAFYALNNLNANRMSAGSFGQLFDASTKNNIQTMPSVPAKIEAAHAAYNRALSRKAAWAPFVVEIPSNPPQTYVRSFQRMLRQLDNTDRFDSIIDEHAQNYGLDPRLVKSVIAAESEFTPSAVSPVGALGLMQVMPKTANSVGVKASKLFNARSNIKAGTAYLAHLFSLAWKRYHLEGVAWSQAPNWLLQRIIASYNAGPKFLARRRLYRQTREYIRKVFLYYRSAVADLRQQG